MRDHKNTPRKLSLWQAADTAVKTALILAGILLTSWSILILLFSLERTA